MSIAFSISRIPRIECAPGAIRKLPALVQRYGNRMMLVTGGRSFIESSKYAQLQRQLYSMDISWRHCRVEGEPSPDWVDQIVSENASRSFDVVVAIGGGSALDGGKAVAGLLNIRQPVRDFLEGFGPE